MQEIKQTVIHYCPILNQFQKKQTYFVMIACAENKVQVMDSNGHNCERKH